MGEADVEIPDLPFVTNTDLVPSGVRHIALLEHGRRSTHRWNQN